MNRPLIIRNVHNLSLESYSDEQPQLVAQFTCVGKINDVLYTYNDDGYPVGVHCSAVWLHDMNNITLRGIHITVQNPAVSGVVLKNVSTGSVQMVSATGHHFNDSQISIGILLYESFSTEVHSSSASYFSIGLKVDKNFIPTTRITNVITMYNVGSGIYLSSGVGLFITNTTTAYNGVNGLYIRDAVVNITNTLAMHNGKHGILLIGDMDTLIRNAILTHNEGDSLYLWRAINTSLSRITATHNGNNGLFIYESTIIKLSGCSAEWNKQSGFTFLFVASIFSSTTIAQHNMGSGITFLNSPSDRVLLQTIQIKADFINTTATHNKENGIYLHSSNANFTNTITTHNGNNGIICYRREYIKYNYTSLFINTITKYNDWYGMALFSENNITIINIQTGQNMKKTIYKNIRRSWRH